MHILREIAPIFVHISRRYGSITTPQLMRLVTDLEKRVYRFQSPAAAPMTPPVQINPERNPILNKIFEQKSQVITFGDLADQGIVFA